MSKITDLVTSLALPIAEENGCKLWDVEYVNEGGDWYLRIYIDKEDGVSIDDCVAVSQVIDPILDEQDPIPTSYTLEVCSAGIERELTKPAHFMDSIGLDVTVKLYQPYNGEKKLVGTLTDYEAGKSLTLELEDESHVFSLKEIAQVRIYAEF